jgi:uncharacterized protein (TIGR03086 family)
MAALVSAAEGRHPGTATPCEHYTLSQLLAHVDGLTQAFRAAADKELGPLTDTDPGDVPLDRPAPGWAVRVPAQLTALVEAWRAPEAWTGQTRAGAVDLPGEVAGVVALNELTLHGWDLARALGRPYDCDDATAEVCLGFVSQFDDSNRGTAFAPPVEVAADAPVFDRVLALAGRDPRWAAPA